ncbi:MAG: hypothetical protein KKB59_19635, partial [Spirochaetes bacterium]|nr:hypothetical protein [Spirochaetota bacterium]
MLKQIGVFSPTGTENPKTPAQFLNQAYSALSENCQFIDEMLQNRLGNEVFIDQELSGAVLFQKQLDFPDNGVLTERRFLVVITTKDIYYLDTGTDTFKYLTPTYTTGTIAVTQTSKTVTGTDTLWAANAKAGDYIRLGALNAATPVWYEIDEVVGNTEITLVTAYAGDTASSQTYTIRKTFTGGRTDYWRYIRIPDKNLGTVYVFANGTDYEIYWDGDT